MLCGPGPNLRIRLLVDRNIGIVREHRGLIQDKGITFRVSYLNDSKGML
jgi:hypothetical protein